MKKVLFHTNIPSPYRVQFFDLLAEKVELTVVYERRSASDRENDWYIEDNKKYKTVFLKGIKYSNDASFAPGIVKLLDKSDYDIFVISGYSSLTQMLAIHTLKKRNIPYILNVDGGMIKTESKLKKWYKSKLIAGANYYFSTGEICDEFLMHYGALKDNLIRYPFTSIREDEVLKKPLNKNEKRNYKNLIHCDYAKMLLSVGQPIHRKGFDILIRALSMMEEKDCGLFIVGGTPNEECCALISEYNLTNIHFVSFKRKEELAIYYKAADAFVFPTREDIWGLVINEAMSQGLPIITTDKCNAGLELVKDCENGYIVTSENSEELKEAVERLLFKDNLEEMSNKSLKKIREYTLEKMVEAYYNLFQSI